MVLLLLFSGSTAAFPLTDSGGTLTFPDTQVHICSRCNFPIAIYGQLLPCKHAFCLQCAYEMGPTCYLCFEKVDEIKKIEACKQALYMCGVCLKSYESMTDLMARVKQNGGGCCQAQPRDKQDNTQAPVGMDVSIV